MCLASPVIKGYAKQNLSDALLHTNQTYHSFENRLTRSSVGKDMEQLEYSFTAGEKVVQPCWKTIQQFLFKNNFIYLFLALLGLHFCLDFFLGWHGHSPVAVGSIVAVPWLQSACSIIVVQGVSCLWTVGSSWIRQRNPCLLPLAGRFFTTE